MRRLGAARQLLAQPGLWEGLGGGYWVLLDPIQAFQARCGPRHKTQKLLCVARVAVSEGGGGTAVLTGCTISRHKPPPTNLKTCWPSRTCFLKVGNLLPIPSARSHAPISRAPAAPTLHTHLRACPIMPNSDPRCMSSITMASFTPRAKLAGMGAAPRPCGCSSSACTKRGAG